MSGDRVSEDPVALGTYRSRILDLFEPYIYFRGRRHLRPETFVLPEKFSLSENPEDTIQFLHDVIAYVRQAKVPKLALDHRNVRYLGLAADSILGVILREISLEIRHVRGAYIRGYKPRDGKIRNMMDEVGCVRVLNAGSEEDIKVSLQSGAKVFRHQNRGKALVIEGQVIDQRSQTCADFADHLQACLAAMGYKLTPAARSELLTYVGEILDNAQTHSGLAQWVIVGFIDLEDQDLVYRCVIASFGNSMADTFLRLDREGFAWTSVEPYLLQHKRTGLFSSDWHEEDLLTVMALQGDVSSINTSAATNRGQGTVDFIEFFQGLSEEAAMKRKPTCMTITSGATAIRFDGRHKMQFNPSLQRSVIAFNQANDLLNKPDSSAVQSLQAQRFPGVVISIAAPLSSFDVEKLST
ncbi:hypothetical protein HY57_13530 [Dyella japonica A8]|uniref:Uncharacterized protein n=2 Tax=Dyella japonica TaxID=231455 RepID=A0A075K3C5_9GAMM|nr:hypothetical protein HY57_13530 [Dyella japonica A8]